MKIASFSSKKLGDGNEGLLENKNLYNDTELFEDADLDWYDYGFRNYDPEIGRFPQLDSLTDNYPELTNYQYASNEPIANVDLDGLEAVKANGVLKIVGPSSLTFVKAAPYAVEKTLSFSSKVGIFFKGVNTGINLATAKPLHISLKAGDLNFLYILEDLFHQSMLAFSAPDRSNALPFTIKLIDTLLEPLAAATEHEEEQEDDEPVDEEMQNITY